MKFLFSKNKFRNYLKSYHFFFGWKFVLLYLRFFRNFSMFLMSLEEDEDEFDSAEGLKSLGHNLIWAAMGGDPTAMSTDVLINSVKSELIDPIFSPKLRTPNGERTGGKFVIKQSFRFRDLKPTIRKGETKEDTKIIAGDVMLPAYAGEAKIDFKNPDFVLKIQQLT